MTEMQNYLCILVLLLVLTSGRNFASAKYLVPLPVWNASETILLADRQQVPFDSSKDFNYALCRKSPKSLSVECDIFNRAKSDQPISVDDGVSYTDYHCKIQLTVGDDPRAEKDIELLSMHHFNEQTVILKWLENQHSVVLNAKYTILDMDTCDTGELSFPMNKAKSDRSFVNELVISKHKFIHVITSSKSKCKNMETCRFSFFKPGKEMESFNGQPLPINLNLTEVTLRDGLSFPHFFVEGYEWESKIYRYYHLNGNNDALTNLDLALDHGSQAMSLRGQYYYIVCYVDRSSYGKSVYFTQYNTSLDVTLNANVTVEFPESVQLVDVTATLNHEDDVSVLITRKADCQAGECWDVYVTKFLRDEPKETKKFKFDCAEDGTKIITRVHAQDDDITLLYGCEKQQDQSHPEMRFWNVQKIHI